LKKKKAYFNMQISPPQFTHTSSEIHSLRITRFGYKVDCGVRNTSNFKPHLWFTAVFEKTVLRNGADIRICIWFVLMHI